MITTAEKPSKAVPRDRAQAEFTKLLAAAETRGFYGTASLTVTVQNGHIEYVKVAMERMIR